jgi:trimeric autotransporter adhesin
MKRTKTRFQRENALAVINIAILFSAFGALLMAGCKGFFIGPALTTVTVAPSTPSVAAGKTQQMSATGTYDNGSTDTITDSASWATSDISIATVSSKGLVTGVASGTATISATLDGLSGSTTVNVTVANLSSISITPTSQSISSGATQQFTAIGTLQNGTTVDLTSSVTWTSSNTAAATIDSSGLATAKTVTSTETTNITAQSGSITSGTAVLSVTSN